MREVLLKKRCGVPAALLVLLVLVGAASAVIVATFTYETTITDPLSFEKTNAGSADSDTLKRGESDNITVKATNTDTAKGYGIFVDADVVIGEIALTEYSENTACAHVDNGELFAYEDNARKDWNGDGDRYDAKYNIVSATSTTENAALGIEVTINTNNAVSTGPLKIVFKFHRKSPIYS